MKHGHSSSIYSSPTNNGFHQNKKRARLPKNTSKSTSGNDQPQAETSRTCELTLLEKATQFRSQNPAGWQQRVHLRRQRSLEMKGKYRFDPFLVEYNDRIARQKRHALLAEEKRKHEQRRVNVEISYMKHSIKEDSSPSFFGSSSTECSESLCDLTKYNNDDDYSSTMEDAKDLVITIRSAFNLNNNLEADEKPFNECYLKVFVLPDYTKHGKSDTRRKTCRRFVTTSGMTSWNHDFVFRGLSIEQLHHKYFVIVAYGNREHSSEKVCLGQVVLAGSEAQIDCERQIRSPTHQEKQPLDDALRNPGKHVAALLEFSEEDCSFLPKKNSLFLQRKPSIRRHRSPHTSH